MKILGIAGKKHSGKSLVAKIIKELYANKNHEEFPVHIIAFADSLKEEVALATGHTVAFINAHKDNFRLILQGWGTDFRRELDWDKYWLDKLAAKVKLLPNNSLVIIPDVRFLNETNMIKTAKGTLWKIERVTTMESLKDNHPSETSLDNYGGFDRVIKNFGTIEELKTQVINIWNQH